MRGFLGTCACDLAGLQRMGKSWFAELFSRSMSRRHGVLSDASAAFGQQHADEGHM
jgi:hypothetical protein